MADGQDYINLRADTGLTVTDLDDPAAAAVYAYALAAYPSGSVGVQNAAARVIILQRRLAEYMTQATYTQNQESESLSDVFKNIKELLAYWQKRLNDALAADAAAEGNLVPPRSNTVRLRPVW